MNFLDRIKAALGILEGKTTADKAQIASITAAAATAAAAAELQITALTTRATTAEAATATVTAQLVTANDALAAIGDPVALAAAVTQLEALAAQP